MGRNGTSVAARATAKGHRRVGLSHRFLANLYLHILDRIWERRQLQQRLGARIVRYADDIVILCRKQPDEVMTVLRRILERLGLTLNEAKTKTINAFEGSTFWGSRSGWGGAGKQGDIIPMSNHRRNPCNLSKTGSPVLIKLAYGLFGVATGSIVGQTIEVEAVNVKKQIEEMKTFREYMAFKNANVQAKATS